MQDFSGERYTPNLDSPEISYEHWHRYLYATLFVKGKVLLDIACGEGYGSYLLAQHARRVVGVDISADTINHAASTYTRRNLEFKVGSLGSIPVEGEEVFDGVVSFESIEHVGEERQDAFVREVKRILKPGGFLLISTPNRRAYSDIPAYENKFHLKEFYIHEFRSFLEPHFEHVRLVGQRIYPVSYLWDTQGEASRFVEFRISSSPVGFRPTTEEKVPLYVLALCSDKEIRGVPQSVQVDLSGRILTIRDEQIQVSQSQVAERDRQVQALTVQVAEGEQQRQELTEQVAVRERQVQALLEQVAKGERQVQAQTEQVAEGEGQVQALSEQVAKRGRQVHALSAQLDERDGQVQALTEQLAEREKQAQDLNAQLYEIKISRAWRAVMLLRRMRGFLIPQGSWRARLARKTLSFFFLFSRDMRLIRNSGYLDREMYLAHNPDVAQAGVDPARHYLLTGGFEGRDPGPNFASEWYLETYSDVQAARINPLVHYLRYGQREGRAGKPDALRRGSGNEQGVEA